MTILALLMALAVAMVTTIILISIFYYAIFYVPYVPTPGSVARLMVQAADLKDGQTVIDLGCGDGRLLGLALEEKKVRVIGYEVNWMALVLARLRFLRKSRKPLILRKNFFSAEISAADVVFCYLFPKTMEKLKEKFLQELKPGTIVISYSFPMKGWEPEKIIETNPQKPENYLIYRYRIS